METVKENLGEFLGRLTSRKFLGTVIAILIPILNRTNNWGLTETEIALITGAIATYIIANTVQSRLSKK